MTLNNADTSFINCWTELKLKHVMNRAWVINFMFFFLVIQDVVLEVTINNLTLFYVVAVACMVVAIACKRVLPFKKGEIRSIRNKNLNNIFLQCILKYFQRSDGYHIKNLLAQKEMKDFR